MRMRTSAALLVGLEFATGAAAVVGGLLLAARADGSLLKADPAALEGSPFADWRVPGVLLATMVGGGFLSAGTWQWRDGSHAPALSVLAGCGLVTFECAELAWLGFHPLEAVFAGVGAAVAVLAPRQAGPAELAATGDPQRYGGRPQ